MNKKSVIKYIPYIFYALSGLGIVLGVLYPEEIPMMWVVMAPYVIGLFLQSSTNQRTGGVRKVLKIVSAVVVTLILVCVVVILSLFLR